MKKGNDTVTEEKYGKEGKARGKVKKNRKQEGKREGKKGK